MQELKQDLEHLVAEHGIGCGGIRLTVNYLTRMDSPLEVYQRRLRYFKVPGVRADLLLDTAGSSDIDLALLERIGQTLGFGSGELVAEYQDKGNGPELHCLDITRTSYV